MGGVSLKVISVMIESIFSVVDEESKNESKGKKASEGSEYSFILDPTDTTSWSSINNCRIRIM